MVQTARAVVSNTGNKVQTLGPLKNKSGKKRFFFRSVKQKSPNHSLIEFLSNIKIQTISIKIPVNTYLRNTGKNKYISNEINCPHK
jgi:hypothetical protein